MHYIFDSLVAKIYPIIPLLRYSNPVRLSLYVNMLPGEVVSFGLMFCWVPEEEPASDPYPTTILLYTTQVDIAVLKNITVFLHNIEVFTIIEKKFTKNT